MNLPGALLPFIAPQLSDATGAPLALGTIECFESGSTTVHKSTFSNPDLAPAHVNTNPIGLGADGRPPTGVYLEPGGYYVELKDAAGILVWAGEVEDVGQSWLGTMGPNLTRGSKSVKAYYTVTSDDGTVTIASTGEPAGCPITLPLVSSRSDLLCLKNMGTVVVSVYPSGSDTIDGAGGVYTLPAAAGGVYPTLLLAPDGVSNWVILGSHNLA
jgi:hypothetical protein